MSLSKGITLVESSKEEDQKISLELLTYCHAIQHDSKRIAISGSPGVGKSTFINAFGLSLVHRNSTVAVLAIDPSSSVSKGSILGDKTRMSELGRSDLSFIRPSPNQEMRGGLGVSTYEISILCEAAGFDFILVETVGVGQSEIAARYLCDMFLLLLQPAAGDELQTIKKGIVEIADLFIVTKADGEMKNMAKETAAKFRSEASSSLGSNREIVTCSSIEGTGLADVFHQLESYYANRSMQSLRRSRDAYWFAQRVEQQLIRHYLSLHKGEIGRMTESIQQGLANPFESATIFTSGLRSQEK